MQCLAAVLLSACALGAAAEQRVEVPTADSSTSAPLVGHWFAAEGAARRPAVVLLHGCGGPYDKQGRLSQRLRDYAALLNAEGWHALVLDSLSSRGIRELCTQRIGERTVTQSNRRLDALGALQWLALRSDVDPQRLALLGWSNGGSTVLAATNRRVSAVANANIAPRAAVALYPGCETDLRRGHDSSAPLLLLVGASDDWTPAASCVDLAAQSLGRSRVVVYEGAYHGFDDNAPLRVRKDVPNGVKPGQGVTVGGNAAAREASQREMLEFLRTELK
jgi:dienelactone hydrolase